jgi:GT2 family glycosyltransferase
MERMLVVIPTYNHFDYASKAHDSVLAGTACVLPRILIVDDASPDVVKPTADFLAFRDRLTYGPCVTRNWYRFATNGGLTRSWNFGLYMARVLNCEYACVANSDVVFPRGWDQAIIAGLGQYDLVGPVTNAPGTEKEQYVGQYSHFYRKDAIESDHQKVQDELAQDRQDQFREGPLNGFCMIARTATWWKHAYSDRHVFRPRNDFNSKGQPNPTPLMTLNEYELQARWRAAGLRSAVCLASYVLHYRAVSRGDSHRRGDWLRKSEH